MILRTTLIMTLTMLIAACAAPSDRYKFWNDKSPYSYAGDKPNLGDVPDAPDVSGIKAELEAVRQKLEQDRDAANQAAKDLAPPPAQIEEVPFEQSPVGNVVYNYGQPKEDAPYQYGFSAVNIRAVQNMSQGMEASVAMAETPNYESDNGSVSIDWSALGESSAIASNTTLPVISGEPAVYFGYGSARIGGNDRDTLSRMAEAIKTQGKQAIVVGYASKKTGLSDLASSHAVNLKMSANRANAVLHALAKQGVDPAMVNVVAYGDTLARGIPSQDQRVDIKLGE